MPTPYDASILYDAPIPYDGSDEPPPSPPTPAVVTAHNITTQSLIGAGALWSEGEAERWNSRLRKYNEEEARLQKKEDEEMEAVLTLFMLLE